MNGATASASSVIPASSCSITNTINTVVISGMPRRKQQRVHYGMHAPGVDRDPAHGIADRMGAVRTERLSLHVREQVLRQCGRPYAGRAASTASSARLQRGCSTRRSQGRPARHRPAGLRRWQSSTDTAATSSGQRTAERRLAKHMVDQHLNRPRLQQRQASAQHRRGDNRHPPTFVWCGVAEKAPITPQTTPVECSSWHAAPCSPLAVASSQK